MRNVFKIHAKLTYQRNKMRKSAGLILCRQTFQPGNKLYCWSNNANIAWPKEPSNGNRAGTVLFKLVLCL